MASKNIKNSNNFIKISERKILMRLYETNRLILRELDETFAMTVLNYYQRNKDFLMEWEAERPEDFFTLEYHSERLKKDMKLTKSGSILKLWLFHKEDKDFSKTIGCIHFSNIVRSILQSCILGYKLDKSELNKGYITEALQKGIEIIFNEYQLHRIEAPIMPRNEASIRVVKKLGFENEGIAKKLLKVNGKWEDHMRWVLLNDKI
jgi:ribosomal-protein-alanine N-acetyltransferase